MYANLYGNLRYRPRFADFRVNLRDGTTGVFGCQFEQTVLGAAPFKYDIGGRKRPPTQARSAI
jgi:hypothetical protein